MITNKEILLSIAGHLKAAASDFEKLADADAPTEKPKPEKVAEQPEVKKEKKITLEDVRAVLADKARKGHRAEVKELLTKHGATKLSDIDPSEYEALMKEAGGITDA